MKTLRLLEITLALLLLANSSLYSQANSKFQKKITSYLSKDEVLKAEEFCEQQKTEQDRAECYTLMGDNSLGEMEYAKAMQYYLKAKNRDKEYKTLLEAEKSGNLQLIDNLFIRLEKEKNPNADEPTLNHNAFMPIAQICFSKKDFKNAGSYYEKAGVKQLSIECKVLHAINSKDYISVVELSEQETIGLKNTMEVYKNAADQYFEKSDYKNAHRCYSKVGDKSKANLCFEKEMEIEVRKSLSQISGSRFEFSENPETIVKKLQSLRSQILSFEKISYSYDQNGYSIEAGASKTFLKLLNSTIEETLSGCFLNKISGTDTKDGKRLLSEAWKSINQATNDWKFVLSVEKQKVLKKILEEIRLLNNASVLNIQNLADKQLEKSEVSKASYYYQLVKAIESAKKLMDDYFISINTNETSKNTSWLILGIVKKMHDEIIKKFDNLYDSEKSEITKKKIIELKKSHKEYYIAKLKETLYMRDDFKPGSWSEYLIKKELEKNYNQNIVN
jgi:ribosomal protein S13